MNRKALWCAIAVVVAFWVVWGLSAKEVGNLGWGNIVTVKDQGAADLFGLPGPGAYVGTRNGKALPAVRGGLKLMLTLADVPLGFRAVIRRMLSSGDGYIFTATLLLLVAVVVMLFVRHPREARPLG